MTEELDKAFELANLMTVVANQKMALLEEFEQSTFFFHNGGCFKTDQLLISFLTSLKDLNQNTIVLLDTNNLPIKIDDLESFRKDVITRYFEASNKYLAGYQTIKSNKQIKSILEL